jgi:hypothetical protein
MSSHSYFQAPASGWRLPRIGALRRLGHKATPRLDLETLPDHLKRDLGLLGGRHAPPRNLLLD